VDDRSLGDAISCNARVADDSMGRCEIDDAARHLTSDEMPSDLLAQEEGPGDVGFDHRIPIFKCNVECGLTEWHGGIVYDHVQLTERLDCGIGHPLDAIERTKVER
jgi:hypothetical protein